MTLPCTTTDFAGYHDRSHGGVGGLKANLGAFAVEALQRGVGAIHQRDHDFAVAGRIGFLDEDVIAIDNMLVFMLSPFT